MKREIKFRGKRIDTGIWIYGYYVLDPLEHARIYLRPFSESTNNTYFYVHPESVGQYTGLPGKNDKEIYEGDICKTPSSNGTKEQMAYGCIVFHKGSFLFHRNGTNIRIAIDMLVFYYSNCEIIGNIFENPELLK